MYGYMKLHHHITTPPHHHTTTPQHHHTTTPPLHHHTTTSSPHHRITTPQVRLVLHYEATFTLRGLGLLVDPYLEQKRKEEEERKVDRQIAEKNYIYRNHGYIKVNSFLKEK